MTKISGTAAADAQAWASGLKSGATSALVLHLAEGVDATSTKEWYTLIDKGLALPGVSLIHATGLGTTELADALGVGVKIIWSPQSNLDLYGDTTHVPTALNLGLTVALGPDWTPSGSMNQLDEMKCAKQLSDKRWGGRLTDEMLLHMVTTEAAKALGAQGEIGRLATGYLADIAVFAGDRAHPASAVVAARPETVKLVLVAGKPLFGDEALMAALNPQNCESFDACGQKKTLCMKDGTLDKGTQGYQDVVSVLQQTLQAALTADKPTADYTYGYELWPLFKCGAEADALINCDVTGAAPSADDTDGDGLKNDVDTCPTVWDPDQSNLDGDKDGDACDVCPLVPNATTCPKPGPDDLDGDGVLNAADNCPNLANTDQKDQDGDLHGDKCDPCPTQPNPGTTSCPVLPADVTEINQNLGNGVAGEQVATGALVVTATKKGSASVAARAWAQMQPTVLFGGIELQLASTQKLPNVGAQVKATGIVADVTGRRVLQNVSLTPVPGLVTPVPLMVDATTLVDDAQALGYHALLVQVGPVTVTAQNADAASGKDYGEVLLNDILRLDDELITWGTDATRPNQGDVFQWIVGLGFYSFGENKVLPRGAADFGK